MGCKSALFGSDLIWRLVSVALAKACIVVLGSEGRQSQSQLLHGGEEAHPKQLFLEHANVALCDPVALGLAHIGGRTGYAEELDLLLEVIGQVASPHVV